MATNIFFFTIALYRRFSAYGRKPQTELRPVFGTFTYGSIYPPCTDQDRSCSFKGQRSAAVNRFLLRAAGLRADDSLWGGGCLRLRRRLSSSYRPQCLVQQ